MPFEVTICEKLNDDMKQLVICIAFSCLTFYISILTHVITSTLPQTSYYPFQKEVEK